MKKSREVKDPINSLLTHILLHIYEKTHIYMSSPLGISQVQNKSCTRNKTCTEIYLHILLLIQIYIFEYLNRHPLYV